MKKKTVQHPKSSAGTHPKIENVNIKSVVVLATPDALHQELPLTPKAVRTVSAARRTIAAILDGKDPRQLVIVGPCTISRPPRTMQRGCTAWRRSSTRRCASSCACISRSPAPSWAGRA